MLRILQQYAGVVTPEVQPTCLLLTSLPIPHGLSAGRRNRVGLVPAALLEVIK